MEHCSPSAAVQEFFDSLSSLSAAQVVAMSRVGRGMSALHLELDPDFLGAVADGRWRTEHEDAALQAHVSARAAAAGLVSWRHRRAVAGVLEDAALVLLSDRAGEPLAACLRERLAAPWREVTGIEPGAGAHLAA